MMHVMSHKSQQPTQVCVRADGGHGSGGCVGDGNGM